jgi:integrase
MATRAARIWRPGERTLRRLNERRRGGNHHEGTTIKGGKTWSYLFDLDRAPNGRRRQRWGSGFRTKKEAELALARAIHQAETGIPLSSNRLTVGEYLERWLGDVVAVRNRPRTLEAYGTIVRLHLVPALGTIRLQKLAPEDVAGVVASLIASGRTTNTARHVYAVLSKALRDALRQGLVQRNVCQAVEPPSPGRYEVTVPEPAGIVRVLRMAGDTPYGPILRFLAYTGCRRGEAVALRWQNVDLDRGVASIVEAAYRLRGKGVVIQQPKSAAGRRGVALDPSTVAILREHRGRQVLLGAELGGAYQDRGFVFPGPLGGPLDPGVVTRNWERLARRAGYSHLRLHDLRHAHAAGLIRVGVHPRVVQDRLGHASAAFTMQVYGHVAAGLQGRAAEAFADLMDGLTS